MLDILNRYLMHQTSLQKKMMSILLILTVIPVSIIFLFVYIQQSKLIDRTVTGAANHEFQMLSEHVNAIFSQAVETSSLFFLDSEINELLTWKPESEEDLRLREQRLKMCMNRYSTNISGIFYYTALLDMNGGIHGTGLMLDGLSYSEIVERPWFSRFYRSSFEIVWTTDNYLNTYFVSSPSKCIYIIRQIKNLETWENIGLLILAIPSSQLVKSCIGYMQDNTNFYLLDDSGVISYFDSLRFGKNYVPSHPEISLISESSFTASVGDRKFMVNSGVLARPRWIIVTYTDYAGQISAFFSTKILYLLLIAIYILLASLLSYQMSKQFLAPIKQLHRSMQAVRSDNLNVVAEVSSHDEIGDLAIQFNSMLAKINILMENIVREQEAKRKSEVMALQAQINPHFLYNTLASVRYMIYTGDKKNADLVILSLIKILKNATSISDDLNTVEKELDLLNSYIFIQQFTFSNPIHVQFEVQDEIKSCRILKMILQPIVENAILHGLKPKKGDKTLVIKGRKIDDQVEFQVIDNGIGFDVSLLSAGPKSTSIHSNIAINNVSSRLSLHFGIRYKLRIQSVPGEGTCVTIPFPYIQEEEFAVYEHLDS